MNGAGNKVGIETDPVSSQEQDCLSCSTVISSKVSTDPRQTHRTYCVVRFYSSLFPRALSVCMAGEKAVTEKEQETVRRVSLKNETICQ